VKKKQLPLLERVEIVDVAAEGKALARVGEMVVFVPFAAPGDIVDVQLNKKRKNYAEGWIVRFHRLSPLRADPFCEHFTDCGGCKWQHLPYELQLQYKRKEVCDQLRRIGKIELPDVCAVIGSELTVGYRNKLEFTFSDHKWTPFTSPFPRPDSGEADDETATMPTNDMALGFHISGRFDKVLDIRRCHLQEDVSNRIRLFIKKYCIENGYSFFNLRELHGLMRTVIVRTSTSGETMVIVVFYEEDVIRRESLLEALKERFPEITSLMYVINGKQNDSISDLTVQLYSGSEHLTERMEDLKFLVGPKSFYQTNSRQACRLYKVVREYASLLGDETVYDLYTGAGTIACFLASVCRKVIGIEYVKEAVEDAVRNAQLNNIDNAAFFSGDMKELLTAEFIAANGKPDVIVTDPPRSGMHSDVIATLLQTSPRRIVYVSCNPATQARDLNMLADSYEVIRVQPVDMFPHTQHIENVALLEKRTT
jgi:23S rRNA (uracil1939-C5)-methyltransferase